MFRIAIQTLSIAVLVAFVSYLFFADHLQNLLITEACNRQVRNVCRAVEKKFVTLEEVCHVPLPEISKLKSHYNAISVKDQRWYQDHGWNYYPQVRCDGDRVQLFFMDKKFICKGMEVIPLAE